MIEPNEENLKMSRSQILFPDSNSSTGSVAGHAGANR